MTSVSSGVRDTATATAHAKAILVGEHSVVHGAPAIATPLDALTITATAARSRGAHSTLTTDDYTGTLDDAPEGLAPTVAAVRLAMEHVHAAPLDVEVRNEVPLSAGLGSSAATAAAIVRAIAGCAEVELDEPTLHALVHQAEQVAHGTPSGLDARTVVAPGPIWFQSGASRPLPVGAPVTLVVADSGSRGSTREMVAHVQHLRRTEHEHVEQAIATLTQVVHDFADGLERGDVDALGTAMSTAHAQLRGLGVSTPHLDTLVEAAMAAGSAGAKLTGGGGGGCVLALARTADDAPAIAAALRAAGARATWTATVETT
ncbi:MULTISPECIES: mevalonate kinase [unclassified Agrococcus]|uniref:mevalonate kinase n=1 Tax=unclassified Agrococcus TaxID=2615065 RepID=UPI003616CA22